MQSPPAISSGTGLIYVMLLLLVLGGGAVAVWLIVKNGTPRPPAPAPAPNPAPAPKPGDWAEHAASGRYINSYDDFRFLLLGADVTQETCAPAACRDKQVGDLKFPPDIKKAWSSVEWTNSGCVCGVFTPPVSEPVQWAGGQLPVLCPKSAALSPAGIPTPYSEHAKMYTNYDQLLTVSTPAGTYNLCDDFVTKASR